MSEWKEYKLGDIADFIQGLAINSKTKHLIVQNGGLPLLRIKDLIENKSEIFIDEKNAPVKCIVSEDDLIMSRTGQVGFVFMNKKGVLHNNSFRIVPHSNNKDVFLPYLYWYFNNSAQREYLTSISAGSVQSDLTHKIFKEVEILLPPIEEQKIIAGILSSLDAKIDLLNRQNLTLEAMAEILFRQYFIENPKPEWKEGLLGDLIVVKYGKDHKHLSSGSVPLLGSGGLMRNVDKFIYNKESVLIPRKGTLSNVMYINEPFWTVDTMFYTEMKRCNIAKFIYHFVNNLDLTSMNVGSAVPSMTTQVLNNIPLNIPIQSDFDDFECVVSPIYIKQNHNKTKINTLIKLRDTLSPKLMSNVVRVE